MRGKRLRRGAVAIRVLEAVDVDHHSVHAAEADVAEVARDEILEERLTARGASGDFEAAVGATFDGMSFAHGLISETEKFLDSNRIILTGLGSAPWRTSPGRHRIELKVSSITSQGRSKRS